MSSQPPLSDSKQRLLENFLRGQAARQSWEAPLAPHNAPASIPLSPNQHQLVLHTQVCQDSPVFQESVLLQLAADVDPQKLEGAFQEIVRRHQIFRTAFPSVDGQVVQAIYDAQTIPLPFDDLRNLRADVRQSELARLVAADTRRPFDLSVGPLVRPRLIRMDDQDFRLHLALHQIVFDGPTIERVLIPELNSLCAGDSLPEPTLQFADFALWQDRHLKNDLAARQVEYWRRQLAGPLHTLKLPADRERPAQPSHAGARELFQIPTAVVEGLKALAQHEGATLYMVLLAALKSLLFRYTESSDVLVGASVDLRKRPEFENLAGYLQNTVLLRTQPAAETTFREFLKHVKDVVLSASGNADVPFDQVAAEVHLRREMGNAPLVQVAMSLSTPQTPQTGWALWPQAVSNGTAISDLHLHLEDRAGAFTGSFTYSTDLFDLSTIQRAIGHLVTLLEGVVEKPSARLSDLPLLTDHESQQLCGTYNATRRDVPADAVHQLFEARAERRARSTAIETGGRKTSYTTLNHKANRLARVLQEKGVGTETLAAIRTTRADLPVAMLAAWKAGGACLVLDTSLPEDRQIALLHDFQASVLITSRDIVPLKDAGTPMVECDEGTGTNSNLRLPVEPDRLACVLNNGAEITHGALINYLRSLRREPGFRYTDSLLTLSGALELFLPLISGGRLILPAEGESLAKLIVDSRCTYAEGTAAAWQAAVDVGWPGHLGVKILCGAPTSRDLADALLRRSAGLWIAYGADDAVRSTIYKVAAAEGLVPIGRPMDNTQVYVLDRQRHAVPAGVYGELYVAGDGVARAFRNRPGAAKERFVPAAPGFARLYRTGDRARWRADGFLELAPPHRAIEAAEVSTAPQDELEQKLASLFARYLELLSVGTNDNFFALGGHSLLAAQLMRAVEQELGARLPLLFFFQSPTVAGLASLLRDHVAIAVPPRVETIDVAVHVPVLIAPPDDRIPLIWMHDSPTYEALAEHLAPDWPLLNIDLPRPSKKGFTLEDVVDLVLPEIRRQRPTGPYYLGGFCSEGLVAYEAAVQLRAAGEDVRLVILLDTANPDYVRSLSRVRIAMSNLAFDWKKRRKSAQHSEGMRVVGKQVSARHEKNPAANATWVADMTRAARNYHPRAYDGPIAAIQAADRPSIADLRVSWAYGAATNLRVYNVAGRHHTILSEPYVAQLAARMNTCMNAAAQPQPVPVRKKAAG